MAHTMGFSFLVSKRHAQLLLDHFIWLCVCGAAADTWHEFGPFDLSHLGNQTNGFQKASGPQQMTPTHFPTSHPAARTCSAIKSACHCLQSQSPAHKKSLNGNNKAGYGNKNADKVNISVVASKVEVSVLFPSFWRGFFTFKGEHLQCLRRK